MSSRNLSPDYSLNALELDLAAVVDRLQLERFILLGANAAGHAAVRFAINHPERVLAIILAGCSVTGRSWPVINALDLAAHWDLFPGVYMAAMRAPTPEHRQLEIQQFRQSVTQDDWLIMARAWMHSTIIDEIPRLQTPVLVLHPLGYENLPSQRSMEAASRMPNARLALIAGNLEFGDADAGILAITSFLANIPAGQAYACSGTEHPSGLSSREMEVLRLLAAGNTNQRIAEQLVISQSTVSKHVSSVLAKTGAANRTEASVYAREHGLA